MRRSRPITVIGFYGMLIVGIIVAGGVQSSVAMLQTDDDLDDITIIADVGVLFFHDAMNDPYGIEWTLVFQFSINESITDASNVTYKRRYHCNITDSAAGQWFDNTNHSPSHLGLRFYDTHDHLLAAPNTSLSFTWTAVYNKNNDELVSENRPHDAANVHMVAYYSNTSLYNITSFEFLVFSALADTSPKFYPDVSRWGEGDNISYILLRSR